jgi:aminobenzoyl-glutamate utilization protein B
MMVAAKTLSLTGIDLFTNQNLVDKAKEEWDKRRGTNFKYVPLIGNRKPALDYRDKTQL